MKKIRLLLIEDNQLLREGIMAILKNQADIQIVTISGKNDNTVLKIHKLKPNIILLDLGLRNRNSLEVVQMVKKEFPKVNIIMMDLSPAQADVLQYVKAGASGFILKDATLNDFLVTIKEVAEGAKVLPPTLTDSLFSQIVEHALKGGKIKLREAIMMTKREREVIALIADGLSNKEIGQKLSISLYTIKSHVHNIMEKLTLHTRLELANYTYTGETLKTIAKNISTITN